MTDDMCPNCGAAPNACATNQTIAGRRCCGACTHPRNTDQEDQ